MHSYEKFSSCLTIELLLFKRKTIISVNLSQLVGSRVRFINAMDNLLLYDSGLGRTVQMQLANAASQI